MKIIQVLPCLAYGDAIGNDTLAIRDTLLEAGYDTDIYTQAIDNRLPDGIAHTMKEWVQPNVDDIIIYHLAIGWDYIDRIKKSKCKKIAIYHNVTPPKYYQLYNDIAFDACVRGIREVKSLNHEFDYCLADSEYNKNELIAYGYDCDIDVLPILIPFEDYKKEPTIDVINKYKTKKGHNIIFVGRVVPNKRLENVIAVFYLYKKYFDEEARLFLVGSCNDGEAYYERLKQYITSLNLQDVIFPGHISFGDILAYYKLADVFLCMSEHEGFCVPLLEAMCFELPIVAYDAAAIKYTLADSGILVKEKNFLEIAGVINYILQNKNVKAEVINAERERLKDFSQQKVKNQFLNLLKRFINLNECERSFL